MSHCVNSLVRSLAHTTLSTYSLDEKEGGGGVRSAKHILCARSVIRIGKPRKRLVRRKVCNFVFPGQKLFYKFKAALDLTSFPILC